MFFGSYLVQKGFISEDVAIEASYLQAESTPSFIRAVSEKKLLSGQEILDVLNKCENEKMSFSAVCKRDGVLSSDKFSDAFSYVQEKSLNFANILMERFNVDGEELKKHFNSFKEANHTNLADSDNVEIQKVDAVENDSFISSAALESLKELGTLSDAEIAELTKSDDLNFSNESATSEEKTESSDEDTQISAAALESLKELGGLSDEELQRLENKVASVKSEIQISPYSEAYNEKKQKKLLKIIDMTRSSADLGSDVSNVLNSMYQELVMLKDVTIEYKAKISEKLIATISGLLEEMFKQDNKKLLDWVSRNLVTLEEAVNLLWELRNFMDETGSELAFWSTESCKIRYTSNIKRLREVTHF
ncbi:hypothetical protein M899_3125 [Bacteriovorax sp. BSW11_IV]|uniref:hypothetical protein n=1 Tax=Bacteriovorax sp. BSW11_IV TaxID=1353529 RepID=UPI000389FA6D|nr:hypothetical protein [Bacteriovorax sp. BSW11_IV]EQC49539.1 hypothetical protein M899_3125 [Bacteriovorax sp. BSW11_IV]